MALRIPERPEVGQRLRWLRKQADMTGRGLTAAMDSTDSALVTRLEKGVQLNWTWAMKVCNATAGEGQLKDDPHLLFDFLMGIEESPAAVLRDHFRSEGDGNVTLPYLVAA